MLRSDDQAERLNAAFSVVLASIFNFERVCRMFGYDLVIDESRTCTEFTDSLHHSLPGFKSKRFARAISRT